MGAKPTSRSKGTTLGAKIGRSSLLASDGDWRFCGGSTPERDDWASFTLRGNFETIMMPTVEIRTPVIRAHVREVVHADAERLYRRCRVRRLRACRIDRHWGLSTDYYPCNHSWRHAKDPVADGRSDTRICNTACRSRNRSGSSCRAAHASWSGVLLRPRGRVRATHRRSADPQLEAGRRIPGASLNAPCRRETWLCEDKDLDHVCRGEG